MMGQGPGVCAGVGRNRVEIGILGSLTVRVGGRNVPIRAWKQSCLLALLALQPNQVVSSAEIVEVLWGGDPPMSHRNLVQTYVARLRRLMAIGTRDKRRIPSVIVSSRDGYRLEVGSDQLDLLKFTELAKRAANSADDSGEAYRLALDCWRGPVAADTACALQTHPAAIAISQKRRSLAIGYADIAMKARRFDAVVELLQAVSDSDPLDEAVCARLILALSGSGRQVAALERYRRLRIRLTEEFGVEPGAELRAAHGRVLRHEDPAVSGPLTAG
ncbi:DNA-binding SARP family transcriptional activator [Kibdelosporangium banguiense]|uniref:DNA-binding SARP family transcriptional activator n=1 Tax=Kibdelosporangium banguiense TaxID=1365924 RepID=A0ABS4TNU6_9PSEU|nr:BTAD domain-containing putative transcriptional regulator [Kibdelosporangium banguiense]MBP2325674.1 DNA-binding SARP family transcriptional activator [Kibdelosporangium banguiense]